jgi:hypothetical protein
LLEVAAHIGPCEHPVGIRFDQHWPGVAASMLEGLDEILAVVRLKLRRSFVDRSPVPTSTRT